MDLLYVPQCVAAAGLSSVCVNLATEMPERVVLTKYNQVFNPNVSPGGVRVMTNTWGTLRTIVATEGPAALLPRWSRVVLRSTVAFDTLRLGVADVISTVVLPKRYAQSERVPFFLTNVAGGAVGGALAKMVTFPFSVQNPFGWNGMTPSLYKLGVTYAVLPEAAYCGMFYGLYQTARRVNPYRFHERRYAETEVAKLVAADLLIALFTTFVARLATQPLFVASERLRFENPMLPTGVNKKYVSFLQCMRRVHVEDGFVFLLRGIATGPVLYTAALLVSYDYLKATMRAEYVTQKRESIEELMM